MFSQSSLLLMLLTEILQFIKICFLQLKESGNDASLAQGVDELVKRDARDTARAHSPLKPAEDAVLVDTTGQTIGEVFTKIHQMAVDRLKK